MNWLLLYFTPKPPGRLKSKKAQPTAAPKVSPPKNIWLALRATKEKAALAGDQIQKSFLVAQLYDEARTYFQQNV